MKKTLIALLALGSVAMAKDVEILTLPGTIAQVKGNQHGEGWNQAIGKPGTLSADAVAACLTSSSTLASEGWHWSLANNSGDTPSDVTVNQATKTINFMGRNGYNGEIVAATMDIADLLSENNADALTCLTFSFAPTTVNQASFSVWHYDGGSATALVDKVNLAGGTETQTYTAGDVTTPLDLTTGKLFVLFNATSGGTSQTISGFTANATLSQSVPEPTTGTLSLLALAGLCIRRRK